MEAKAVSQCSPAAHTLQPRAPRTSRSTTGGQTAGARCLGTESAQHASTVNTLQPKVALEATAVASMYAHAPAARQQLTLRADIAASDNTLHRHAGATARGTQGASGERRHSLVGTAAPGRPTGRSRRTAPAAQGAASGRSRGSAATTGRPAPPETPARMRQHTLSVTNIEGIAATIHALLTRLFRRGCSDSTLC
jgi:hypothetical protein